MDRITTKCLDTAVLFLIFNRPDTTDKVFQAIRTARPRRLYVAADGPREAREGEQELCEKARSVLKRVDWDCEVKTLYRDKNLGCKVAVSDALSWFFKQEDMGIILEDDCLPSQSFFLFCENLLNKYKDDLRIWHISGDNFQNGIQRGEGDYYFSRFSHIWGWATWADRWSAYDVQIKSLPLFINQGRINSIIFDKKNKTYWLSVFSQVYEGKVDTWDYQWVYTVFSNSGLCIVPNKNLISNIGFGLDATHTKSLDSDLSNIPIFELTEPLRHPYFVVQDLDADIISIEKMFKKENLFSRVLKKLKYL